MATAVPSGGGSGQSDTRSLAVIRRAPALAKRALSALSPPPSQALWESETTVTGGTPKACAR